MFHLIVLSRTQQSDRKTDPFRIQMWLLGNISSRGMKNMKGSVGYQERIKNMKGNGIYQVEE